MRLSPTTIVRLNFDALRRVTDVAVARASVFLGLATNAVSAPQPPSHVLDDKVQYCFVPKEVTSGTLVHFREEFIYWILANALRDLVESFSGFLIHCRRLIFVIDLETIDEAEFARELAEYEKKSIRIQYELLKDIVGLDSTYMEMFETFRKARNCLAHRRGIVSEIDVNTDDSQLRLRWCFMATFLENPDGTEQIVDNDTISLIAPTAVERRIVAHLTWKEREYRIGSQIRLSRHDLGEICFGLHFATEHVLAKLRDFALQKGIPFENAAEGAARAATSPPDNLDRED